MEEGFGERERHGPFHKKRYHFDNEVGIIFLKSVTRNGVYVPKWGQRDKMFDKMTSKLSESVESMHFVLSTRQSNKTLTDRYRLLLVRKRLQLVSVIIVGSGIADKITVVDYILD